MHGGSIDYNFITIASDGGKSYGSGICISNAPAEIILDGGKIAYNHSSQRGSGLYIRSSNVVLKNDVEIKGNDSKFGGGIYVGPGSLKVGKGVVITENQAVNGGGILNNGGEVVIEEGAIIANNRATAKADDISSYSNSIILAPATAMNTLLTTDGSNKLIDGWYQDGDERWGEGNVVLQDITNPITEKVFLKAAHNAVLTSVITFINENNIYAEVNVENGKSVDADALADEVMPKEPGKEGYIFKGWNTEADGKGSTFTGTTIVDGDITVYAIYSKKAAFIIDNNVEATPEPLKPAETGKSSEPNMDKVPQTGEHSGASMYLLIISLSFIVLVGAIRLSSNRC